MSAREPSPEAVRSVETLIQRRRDEDGAADRTDIAVLLDRFAADKAREFIREADGTEDAGEVDAGFFVCLGLLAEHFGVEAPAYRPERRASIVERCCAAVCSDCARSVPTEWSERADAYVHVEPDGLQLVCKASKIRSAFAKEAGGGE